jgi:hypothetical protein
MIDSTRGLQGGIKMAFKVPHSEGWGVDEGGTLPLAPGPRSS